MFSSSFEDFWVLHKRRRLCLKQGTYLHLLSSPLRGPPSLPLWGDVVYGWSLRYFWLVGIKIPFLVKSHSNNFATDFSSMSSRGYHGTHSANFDEKVHKPQSKSYGRISANMQLFYTYLINLNIYISASHFWGVWGTPREPYGCIKPI